MRQRLRQERVGRVQTSLARAKTRVREAVNVRMGATLLVVLLSGCADPPRALPDPLPMGDPEHGRHLFAAVAACGSCHPSMPSVESVDAGWRALREGCPASPRWRDAPDDLLADLVAALVAGPPAAPATILPDAASGARLAALAGCTSCHGEALGGGTAPRLPRNRHGTGAAFRAAMQDGVGADGHALAPQMPSAAYAGLTLTELDALWLWTRDVVAAREGG